MVTRKPLLPHPASSPPPPPPDFDALQANHEVDSADVPPIPQTRKTYSADLSYDDIGNPWQDSNVTSSNLGQQSQNKPAIVLPDTQFNQTAAQEDSRIPDILKPGWSGENTPRSSLDSGHSRDFWEDDSDDEKGKQPKTEAKDKVQPQSGKPSRVSEIPSILQVRRKPISPTATEIQGASGFDHGFASNNPFRPPQSQGSREALGEWTKIQTGGTESKEPEHAHGEGYPDWESLYNSSSQAKPSQRKSVLDSTTSAWDLESKSLPPIPQTQPPVAPTQAPPPVSIMPPSPFSEQPPLIPVATEQDHDLNPWEPTAQSPPRQQSPLPQQKAVYTNDLLDRGSKSGQDGGLLSLGDELKALPNHAPILSPASPLTTATDLSEVPDENRTSQGATGLFTPPPGPPPLQTMSLNTSQQQPLLKPLTQAELAEMNEQRNEKYQIKHFRWFDHRTQKLRTSSMLTQNKNGPCPLLALVNALILGAQDQDQATLDEFLRTREQVTLGTIIENLMMEMLSTAEDGELPDVDELNRFLLKLRTGMNMNPRFVAKAQPAPNLMDARNSMLHIPDSLQSVNKPGSFEPTQDLRLYSAFGVQTVHGWLPEPGTDAAAAFERTAQNYEDAQAKLFGEDELEYKLSTTGLSPEEQVIWEDIVSMKRFLQTNPTQLTQYGLQCIKSSMQLGSFGVLFRNDHFSTIYMHPQDGRLYSLITDAGYADRDEVIWESLVDTSGHDTEFCSGDFKSVSHNGNQSADLASRRQSQQQQVRIDEQEGLAPLSPSQRQEQEDADLAMAMQLQEEEEQRDRQRRAQENSQTAPPQPNRQTGRRSTGNIPIPIRGNNPVPGRGTTTAPLNTSGQGGRPVVPIRGTRPSAPAVNRPTDATDPDAPPAYEEAARGRAYHPPLGSPLHPASSTEGGSAFGSTSNLNLNDANSNANRPGRNRRRSSAYMDNAGQYGTGNEAPSPAYDFTDGRMPGSYIHTGRGGHGQSASLLYNASLGPQNQRQRDRDCIVM